MGGFLAVGVWGVLIYIAAKELALDEGFKPNLVPIGILVILVVGLAATAGRTLVRYTLSLDRQNRLVELLGRPLQAGL